MAKKEEYLNSKRRLKLTPGAVVRIYREMMELSQNDLAKATGFTQATLSGMENGKVTIGPNRAKVLARVFKINPGLILFPQWEDEENERSAKNKVA